jgi:thiol-disulfide isomerase/thioredoxin
MLSPSILSSLYLSAVVWSVPDIVCSTSCKPKLEAALASVEGAEISVFNLASKEICLEDGFDEAAAAESLSAIGYPVSTKKRIDNCRPAPKSLWSDVKGDVKVVSTGERISLRKVYVEGKYTLVDFGASWCGPCVKSTHLLADLLPKRTDFAVRAVELEDMDKAFETPVAFQHLSGASGLPWYILLDDSGREVYTGNNIDEALSLLP